MARPIERIEKDIVELEKAIGTIAQQLQTAYGTYLSVLGQAVRQQLILASYHLCTQGYPENFLRLSLSKRQKLQQAMRKLAKSADQDMQALINDDEEDLEENEEEIEGSNEDLEEDLEDLELEDEDEDLELEDEDEDDLELEDEELEEIAQELEIEDEDLEEIVEKLEMEDEVQPNNFSPNASSSSLPLDAKIAFLSANKGQSPIFVTEPDVSKDWKNWFNPNTSNPMELAAWQKNLERAIRYILKSLSRDSNRLLQKAGILPKKLPPSILEAAAASSEASTDVMPGPPNLLSLVVGVEGEEESESLTQVTALNLRLVEIEFADLKLSYERKQIRNILNQLGKLGREYQKKQRERSIASAEAAWRASWYED
ncbi:MAG: hypothetical protein WBA41_01540 [Rivularia sp. (in: cyanobacteria)]